MAEPTALAPGSMPSPAAREKAMDLSKPLTPKSERRRASYGALGISLANLRGVRCDFGDKCFYPPGHPGPHAGMRNP